jgi:ribonuclease E
MHTGGINLSAEEEPQVVEAEKPKTTRSRVTRTRRKPAEASADGATTAAVTENGATPAPDFAPTASPAHVVFEAPAETASVIETPGTSAPEMAQSVDAPLPAPAADLTETAASMTADAAGQLNPCPGLGRHAKHPPG